MADENKFKPLGRGGRGAQLRNALLQQQRRPGLVDEKQSELPVKNESVGAIAKPTLPALGRSALLSQLRVKSNVPQNESSKVNVQSSQPTSHQAESCSVNKPLGRGRLLKTSVAKSPSQTESSSSSSPEPSLSLSELSISPEKQPVHRRGVDGKEVLVSTNQIRLVKLTAESDLYEYHVSFEPNIDSKNMRFKLMKQLSETIGTIRVFDGTKLYLPVRLQKNITVASAIRYTDEAQIKVLIKFTGAGNLSSKIHLYNILFKKVMRFLNLARIGLHDYDPKGSISIPQHRLEVWPGYVTAVSDLEGGIMLTCDASFRVLRKVTAYDIMAECARKNINQLKNEALRQLIGTIVLTRYNNKTYRIDDISWEQTPMSTFETHTGEQISYTQYYKNSYGIQIEDTNQPILINRPKKREQGRDTLICLIPELCFLTGLTDDLRNDYKVMMDISTHTRISPTQRQICLRKFRDNIMNNNEARNVFAEWGLALDATNIELKGRTLPMEKILFKNNNVDAGSFSNWSGHVGDNEVINAVPLRHWMVIFVKRNQHQVSDFIKKLQIVGRRFGMEIHDPQMQVLSNDSTESYIRCMREQISQNLQLFLVVFPSSRDDRYSAVKKLCCIEQPIPSQVVIAKTISAPPKLTSVSQKIALQINCKLGGELWGVKIPLKNVMICGVDVYHDAKTRGRSVAGFTASLNQLSTRWFSNVHFQNPGEELVNSFTLFLVAACRKYYEVNHALPQKIIVYRDGVGDGQLQHVADHEISQLTDCLKCFGAEYNPSLTVVIVQKRINTRIFMKLRNGLENPTPGTVVDHTVTRKYWYDFFLVSQHVRQGTVTPTHFIVVHDTSKLTPDHLQRLTYKMTHLYYNWPGTVRSPAPCQYAHKLAYLVGQNIHKEPSKELSDRLFYL